MKKSKSVLSVKFSSKHSADNLMTICQNDLEQFKKVPGLIQKYYIVEESTGALSGIYLFENREQRTAFLESDLAKGIPERYGVIPETLRIEQFDTAITMNIVAA
ncbi:YdhR family protein [Mucilaginibacter sp. HMF5004]|uniref:YdhR family protein n=1 Tax=Mucilaginibacter rivuli TaxID=2857527 RepID=UPI001C5E69CD|nr:YdhR family protein [Mucilaginibacter rivuli]MBW4891575.1 YdhR family protein [Mucilaginibacter rivuli]